MKLVLYKHKNFQKSFRASNKLIRLVIGGLVYYEGDEWSKSRMKLNPAFYVEKLKVNYVIRNTDFCKYIIIMKVVELFLIHQS